MWKTLTTRYFIPPIGSSPIGMGVVVSLISVVVGLACLLSGRAFFYNRWHRIHNEPALHWVEGNAAVLGAFFYICIGLYFHFSYYWRKKPHLEKYSPILSNITLIGGLVLGCWGAIG